MTVVEEWGAATDAPEPRRPRSVLERALSVLGCFDLDSTCLTLRELCDRVGLPKSTVYRLAEKMVAMGWLERAPGGYMVGIGLSAIGDLAQRHYRLRVLAMPHLYRLASTTGLAAGLVVLEGETVEYLEMLPARDLQVPLVEGARVAALATSAGRVLASQFPPDRVERLLRSPQQRRTPSTRVAPPALRHELQRARERGFAVETDECFRGWSSVAAAFGPPGRPAAAISLIGPSVPFPVERLGALVVEAVRKLRGEWMNERGGVDWATNTFLPPRSGGH